MALHGFSFGYFRLDQFASRTRLCVAFFVYVWLLSAYLCGILEGFVKVLALGLARSGLHGLQRRYGACAKVDQVGSCEFNRFFQTNGRAVGMFSQKPA